MVKRLSFIFILTVLCVWTAWGNNVRIIGNVSVEDKDVDNTTQIATVKIKIGWDNSWRDAFNYDAVYIFLKYKVDGVDELWHHAYLMNAGHKVTSGFDYLLSNSTGGENLNQGMFIFRKDKGFGNAEVDLELKWLITSNADRPLKREQFTSGSVFLSAMGIEMVYIPRGAFRAGDTKSAYTFENKDITLPAASNILVPENIVSCESSKPIAQNPPEFAVNEMNDISKDNSNAWVGRSEAGDADWHDYWKVTLKAPKKVRSIAIESIEGGTPTKWQFQGLNVNNSQWQALYPKAGNNDIYADGSDWAVNSHRTYPCTRTLKLEKSPGDNSYVVFRILIKETANPPIIKNIAMSEENIIDSVDNSVLIYGPQTTMSDRVGLYADDEDSWAGTTANDYPNGYGAFFTMKYEISQEQYVAFLNKLTAAQQRARTIGADLEALLEGQYVFGPDKNKPSARNGIKLASIGVNDAPYVFANDLNPRDEYSQNGDGQTIACNFLNAGDMMAYADWTGLRPMTELEFEKMSRRPYPYPALRGEYVWNSAGDFIPATGFFGETEGKSNERLAGGNINAEAKLKGPVRSGAFAAGGAGQTDAGASFWGVMDLGGNLAELYYNTNTEGRAFCGLQDANHGDGKINAAGAGDVSNVFWPVEPKAFALRGGSFRDSRERTRISDREKHIGVFGTVNEVQAMKDSTMTFRLGRTAPVQTVVSEVTLESGRTTADAQPVDSICSGVDYTIKGNIPSEIKGAYSIAWFQSSDEGKTWDLLEGETSPSLTINNLRNINSKEDVFKEYWYNRYIYSNGTDVVLSKPVRLMVINHTLSLSSRKDTVDVYDYSEGIRVDVPQAATLKWSWLRSDKKIAVDPEYVLKPNKSQLHYFKYQDFMDENTVYPGDQKILLEVRVMNQCPLTDTIRVFVRNEPTKRNNVNNDGTLNAEFKCGDILIDNEEKEVSTYKKYRTVEIGGRCWFADNLNRTIPTGGKGNSLCYNNSEDSCNVYGRLYNFYAVTQTNTNIVNTEGTQGICPKGWHVPTNQEWIDLFAALGTNVDKDNTIVQGKFVKSTLNNWQYQGDVDKIGNNSSRFNAIPGGMRNYNHYYQVYGNLGTAYSTLAGINARITGFWDINVRSWWWTSSTTGETYTYWHANSNSWITRYLPYFIRMDQDARVYFGIRIPYSSYGYITNTIFQSNQSSGHWIFSNTSDSETNALMRMKTEIYMSVRCVKD